jgi:hypothetical protein
LNSFEWKKGAGLGFLILVGNFSRQGAKAQTVDKVDGMDFIDIWLFGPLEHDFEKSQR